MSLLRDMYKAFTNEPDRQGFIIAQVVNGNTPTWVRNTWTSVHSRDKSGNDLELFFMPDALAIGPNSDPIYTPVYPSTLQAIADSLGAIILNTFLTNLAFDRADQRIFFQSEPLAGMTTVEAFLAHSDKVHAKTNQFKTLRVGHSKVVAIGPNLSDKQLAIVGGYGGANYGWAFQAYNSHAHPSTYLDYSQLGWLVSKSAKLNGKLVSLTNIFEDESLSHLVTGNEGFYVPRYPNHDSVSGPGKAPSTPPASKPPTNPPLKTNSYGMFPAIAWSIGLSILGYMASMELRD